MALRLAERGCVVLLLAYLIWVPMPFGSVGDGAQPPLIGVPLALCAAAALMRARIGSGVPATQPYRVWTFGATAFAAVVALQLVPIGDSLLRAISPSSHALWSDAARVASLIAAQPAAAAHPVSVNPSATWLELFRFLAYFATFQAAALLIRTHERRVALASVLCATAFFEMLYGVREAALHRYAIWGWRNTKMYGRVTGTYVNPNHFAHYAALVFPLAVFLAALAWREAARPGAPLRHRLVRLVERKLLQLSAGVAVAIACIVAILVGQSRGALLALAVACAAGGALALRPERHRRRAHAFAIAKLALAICAGVLLVVSLVFFLGADRTVARFKPLESERSSFVGRRNTIGAAFALWRRFPLLGSGLGTFDRIVSQVQTTDLQLIYNHAHDDYAEIAATTGTLGFLAAVPAIFIGVVGLARLSRDPRSSWRRRAFTIAAFTSICVALVHALVDFNLFIPANPATLAAIAGAAVTTRAVRGGGSGSASADSRGEAPPGDDQPEP